MTSMTSMWSTVEANAWSRDFDYDNYVILYRKEFPQGTPFKEETYKKFCAVFYSVMTKDIGNDC